MTTPSQTINKLNRIANRCREAKGWKPGSIAARAENNIGNLYIYSVIGSSWFEEGVTAESVKVALDGLKGVKTLNIFINSEGGDVFEAKAIYTQLKRFAAEKVVHIDGIAASAATFIAMAGDRIITAPEATWMVHEAWTLAMGNAADLRDQADLLDMMNEDIAAIYSKRTGRPVEEMRALMNVETWMNAQQALDQKFTDEVASYDAEDTDAEASAKPAIKAAAMAETTRQRLASMTPDLLAYRARRAQNDSNAVKENRASTEKRVNPASRK